MTQESASQWHLDVVKPVLLYKEGKPITPAAAAPSPSIDRSKLIVSHAFVTTPTLHKFESLLRNYAGNVPSTEVCGRKRADSNFRHLSSKSLVAEETGDT